MYNNLRDACHAGDLKHVIRLIENGADIYDKSQKPLETACIMNRFNVVKYLVQKGANIDHYYDDGMCQASYYGHKDIVKYLVENKADVNDNNTEALISASSNFNLVEYLVEQGADIHARNNSTIYNASSLYCHNVDVVNYLLIKGAKPERVNQTFVVEYYSPISPGNIIRLYNLYIKGVDISKFWQLNITNLEEKFKVVNDILNDALNTITLKDTASIIISYL